MKIALDELQFLQRVIRFYQGISNLVFFDIGANTGEYTDHILQFRNHSICIHLFEPTSTCFQQLLSKYGSNGQIVVNKWAVSDQNQVVPIYYNRKGSKLASLYPRKDRQYNIDLHESEPVETMRLDQYLEKRGIRKIHFLKIDTEGHELAVLKGLGTYLHPVFIDFIQFEYGGTYRDAGIRLYDMYQLLEKAGYKIGKLYARGITILPYQPWMEDYTYANYAAIPEYFIKNHLFFT